MRFQRQSINIAFSFRRVIPPPEDVGNGAVTKGYIVIDFEGNKVNFEFIEALIVYRKIKTVPIEVRKCTGYA